MSLDTSMTLTVPVMIRTKDSWFLPSGERWARQILVASPNINYWLLAIFKSKVYTVALNTRKLEATIPI